MLGEKKKRIEYNDDLMILYGVESFDRFLHKNFWRPTSDTNVMAPTGSSNSKGYGNWRQDIEIWTVSVTTCINLFEKR